MIAYLDPFALADIKSVVGKLIADLNEDLDATISLRALILQQYP